MMKTLYVAWQNPIERSWFTVGRLSSNGDNFRFDYTAGAEAARDSGFSPFAAFPDPFVSYESERLFPFFGNRLLSRSRREYSDFVKWVSAHEASNDPVALLAWSGGTRMTDSLELFPEPESDENGYFHLHFFVHGLSHMPASAASRAQQLGVGEKLLILRDVQNAVDRRALMLRTEGVYKQDIHFLGYFPRYLASEIAPVLEQAEFAPVQVLRVNPPPAPVQYRVLCCFKIRPSAAIRLFEGGEFMPLVKARQPSDRQMFNSRGSATR
jgi:hypothetical protein